jgi:hypothetical protein
MYTLNYGFDSQLKADSPPDSPGIAEFQVIPADSRDSGQNSRNSMDSGRNQWRNEKYWRDPVLIRILMNWVSG